jgi:hypothetical protein
MGVLKNRKLRRHSHAEAENYLVTCNRKGHLPPFFGAEDGGICVTPCPPWSIPIRRSAKKVST